jgi:monoamine oxidase
MKHPNPTLHPHITLKDESDYLSVIETGLPKTPNPKKVIVAGGGISGLTAAYELLRAGHNPLILEASHRVGGRCLTLRDPPFTKGLYGEAGAMRFPPVHKLLLEYIKKFNLKIRSFKNYNPNGYFYLFGKKIRMEEAFSDSGSVPNRVRNMWNEVIEPIKKLYESQAAIGINAWPQIVEQYNEFTLREFLVRSGWSEEDIEMFGVIGVGLGGYEAFMNIAFLELLRLFLCHNDENQYEIIGGCDELATAFLQHTPNPDKSIDTLESHTHFGARVTSITQNDNTVTICYQTAAGSKKVIGDYAIITIPFPLLRLIEASPPFSRGKQRAIRELHYISSTKVFLQCKTRFWESNDPKLRAAGLTITDLPIRSLYFPEHNRDNQRGVILASYTWEADAQKWESLSPQERITEALKYVAEIYPEVLNEFEVGASVSWHDPKIFSGGAFAFFIPGQMGVLYDDIVAPEGLVHFAGEHASFEHGWVEGAIESALREVLTIHNRINSRMLLAQVHS